ncbi:NAD(P)-dependent oxidoreductase [Paludibacterium sp.]|uniref:NAD(P)-dependent oxidoreductase n=1 Tax=Paludibacterium sp. TaxID=1917523 RepID=UPI0025F6FF4D|nr:NAD(P)-dependent oxidoreductase [Paludibacterium sp.]
MTSSTISCTPARSDTTNSEISPVLPRIGVVGLGNMGRALTSSLLTRGFAVSVFSRSQAPLGELEKQGAQKVSSISALGACNVLFSSLSDDDALESVTSQKGGLLDSLAPGALHISTSTVSPEISRRLSQAHDSRQQQFVAAPILGNPDLVQSQRMFVLLSGHAQACEKARVILEPIALRIILLGQDPGAANLMKLACNVLTASTLQSMGEVIALLRKAGMDEQIAFDIFTSTMFDGRVHKSYGGKIVQQRYRPAGMVIPLAQKDLRLALQEARNLEVPMPTTSLVHDRLGAAVDKGWSALDWSALGALAAVEAGLDTNV